MKAASRPVGDDWKHARLIRVDRKFYELYERNNLTWNLKCGSLYLLKFEENQSRKRILSFRFIYQ